MQPSASARKTETNTARGAGSVLDLGLAGRADDARQLLAELDDRASRSEYVPAFSRLGIQVGDGWRA
jgi:hypothetical protein